MAYTNAYLVSAVRTPVGKAGRSLQHVRMEALGALAVRAALERSGIPADRVDDVLIGCAFPEGSQGMNVGRIIAQKAGLPDSVSGATINRFCSSGLQTIAMASQAIQTGMSDVVVAGGAESMSSVPMTGFYFQPDPDAAVSQPDLYISMGITAERVAAKYGVSREDQDAFALESHRRAIAAQQSGAFDDELVPVSYTVQTMGPDGKAISLDRVLRADEGPRADTTLAALSKLRPAFHVKGSVTAGNSSQMSDGAAAAVVVSEAVLHEFGLTPLARLVGFATAGVAPDLMGIGPVPAIARVLKQTGLQVSDLDRIELNEAFAAQGLAVMREAGLDPARTNVHGGAIALGHPLGCTGAKLTATLLHELRRTGGRYGLCTMCIGGGMGAAAIFENLQR